VNQSESDGTQATAERPVASPLAVLREEFDDWAILFDPDTGNAFGLNPTSVAVWKLLDGSRTVDQIVVGIRDRCGDIPPSADTEIREFIRDLVDRGLAGYEVERGVS
jgi:SynChlorMet cassette protein ScmD